MAKAITKIIRALTLFFAWLIIIVAVLFSLIRFSTPLLRQYHDVFESLASHTLAKPVRFEQLEAYWQGLTPTFTFKQVSLLQPQGLEPLLKIRKLRLGINLIASIQQWRLIPGKITLSGTDLKIQQTDNGKIFIQGVNAYQAAQVDTDSLKYQTFLSHLPSQLKLQLNHVNIDWQSRHKELLSFTDLKLRVQSNKENHYILGGQVMLAKASTVPLRFALEAITQATEEYPWFVKGYLSGHSLDLNGLLSTSQISFSQGVADVALWFHVTPQAWQFDDALINISQPEWLFTLQGRPTPFKLLSALDKSKARLHLHCHWNRELMQAKIEANNVALDFADYFKVPINLAEFSADFQWQPQLHGAWLLQAPYFSVVNRDLEVQGELGVQHIPHRSPKINLLANYNILPQAAVANYMPQSYVSPKLIAWLQQAVVNHKKARGHLVLSGPIMKFPFDHQVGTFLAQTQLQDISLRYLKDWPMLHKLSGQLNLNGRCLAFVGRTGQCLGTKIKSLALNIPHMSSKQAIVLNAKASFQGDLKDGQRFIIESPLHKPVARLIDKMSLSGPMDLDLALEIPLAHTAQKMRLQGELSTPSGQFHWIYPNIHMHHLNAKIKFSEHNLTATNITGRLWDEPVSLQLKTIKTLADTMDGLIVTLTGGVASETLENTYGVALRRWAQGHIHYRAELEVPPRDSARDVCINIYSNLYGLSLNLAPLFNKSAASVSLAELQLRVPADQTLELYTKLDNTLSTATQFLLQDKRLVFNKMNFQLGSKSHALLPKEKGLFVTGELAAIDDALMLAIKQSFLSQSEKAASSGFSLIKPYLKAINLRIALMKLWGQRFESLRLAITPMINSWRVDLDSHQLKGRVDIPNTYPKQGVLRLRLQQLLFDKVVTSNTTANNIRPQDIGQLDVLSENTYYGDKNLGRVSFNTAVSPGLLQLQSLQVGDRAWKFQGQASWRYAAESQQTNLRGRIHIHDLAKMLHDWNYPASIKGQGKLDIHIQWTDALYAVKAKQLSGQLRLALERGQLTHLDSSTQTNVGLGQLINLLSLSNLQRVAQLDFRGLFGKSLNYDDLKGHFEIAQGHIRSDNLQLRGPVADVDVSGRIGLIAQDLNVRVGVVPHVTESLPIVATVAGGPMVGAVTWAVEKLTSPLLQQMTRHEYQVTGAWSIPNVKELASQ